MKTKSVLAIFLFITGGLCSGYRTCGSLPSPAGGVSIADPRPGRADHLYRQGRRNMYTDFTYTVYRLNISGLPTS